jgi:hypothetical protein
VTCPTQHDPVVSMKGGKGTAIHKRGPLSRYADAVRRNLPPKAVKERMRTSAFSDCGTERVQRSKSSKAAPDLIGPPVDEWLPCKSVKQTGTAHVNAVRLTAFGRGAESMAPIC